MKPKFSHFLGFSFILLLMAFTNTIAQEGIPNNEIPDIIYDQNLLEEKPLLNEPAASADKNAQSKELLNPTTKSAKSKSVEGLKNPATKPEEEDALSFNFLYYIIQKFKISDIVEQ